MTAHRWLLLGAALTFTFARMAHFAGWDNAFYFGQLTSVVADNDLLLHNDLLDYPNAAHDRLHSATIILESGAIHNTFSIGPAVLHSVYMWPLVLARPTPWTALRSALAVAALFMLCVTVVATAAAIRKLGVSEHIAALATVAAVAGGPLALYGTCLYANAHLPSALMASLLLLACLRWRETRSARDAVFTGLSAGLLVLQRWQDVAVAAGMGLVMLRATAAAGERRQGWTHLLVAIAVCVSVVMIQLLTWHVYYGRWLLLPQGSHFMQWTHPNLGAFLLSGYHGLLPWMPAFALGLVGAVALATPRRELGKEVAPGLILAIASAIYIAAAAQDWWGGDSYGPRRLVSLTPIAGLGLAAILQRLRPWMRVAIVAATAGWTVFTATAWLAGWDDLSAVFLARASADNPYGYEPYLNVRWLDAWGPAYFLKPGFTFSDYPTNKDRLLGAVAVFAIVTLSTVLWRTIVRSVHLQRALLAFAFAWVGFWVVRLVRMQSNLPYDEPWRQVVRGGLDLPVGLPPSMHASAAVVIGTRHAVRGDWQTFNKLMDLATADGKIVLDRKVLAELAVARHLPTTMPP